MARDPMTSRERMLTAMSGGRPDRVPLYFHLFGFEPPAHMAWSSETERVQRWASVGADCVFYLGTPSRVHPDVTIRSWREEPSGSERYALLCQEYDTPAGVMRQVVREAVEGFGEAMIQSQQVQLFDDYNVPRAVEHAVSSAADIPKLLYLLGDPTDEQVATLRGEAAERKRQADELGVAVAVRSARLSSRPSMSSAKAVDSSSRRWTVYFPIRLGRVSRPSSRRGARYAITAYRGSAHAETQAVVSVLAIVATS